jgi:hypothetical protein
MPNKRATLTVYRVLATLVAAFGFAQLGHSQAVVGQMDLSGDPMIGLYPFYPAFPFYPGIWVSPCYPYATCTAYRQQQVLESRQERLRQLRWESEQRAAAVQSSPAHAVNRAPADVDQIQRQYLGASQRRPQYESSGEYLPEFLDGRLRPGRK